MSRSAEMPFSLSRTPTASMISLLISPSSPLVLEQIAAVDVRVRDRHDPAVGGQRDLVFTRAHQLAAEALVAVTGLGQADPDAAAEVAPEVLGLGQRALRARRRHLEPVVREQVAEVSGHALAQRDVHPAGAVDHETQALGRHLLAGEQLDVGLGVGQPGFDFCPDWGFVHPIQVVKKVGCEAHLQGGPGRRSESPSKPSIGAIHSSTTRVTGPSFTSSTAMRWPKRPPFAPSAWRTRSYRGSAVSGGAASTKLGRLPLRASP